jgi:hypothetical protein
MKRLKEPSTWAGFGLLFQTAKIFVPPQYHFVLDGASGGSAWLAIQLRERATPAPVSGK